MMMPNNRTLNLSPIILALFVVGCASSSGAYRSSLDDGQGPLREDCRNISSTAKVQTVRPRSYQTLFLLSAINEGMAAGVQDGIEKSAPALMFGVNQVQRHNSVNGDVLRHSLNAPRAYCRNYNASLIEVSSAIRSVLDEMGSGTEFVSSNGNFIISDYSHNLDILREKWKDRFTFEVVENAGQVTTMKILREVFVSRADSDFFEGKSNGKVELWVSDQISRKLTDVD